MDDAFPAKSLDVSIRPFEPSHQDAVIALWQRCGLVVAGNDAAEDIAHKQLVQADLFLVAELQDEVIGSVMAGYEGHRGWINYLAVAPEQQRRGLGRRLMERAESELRRRGCPKVNLQVRTTNLGVIAFYERLGYLVEERVSMGKRLKGTR
jgi:ribosomal protein S18 acetylase RimI-like enzyme